MAKIIPEISQKGFKDLFMGLNYYLDDLDLFERGFRSIWDTSPHWNLDYSGIPLLKTPLLESVAGYCLHSPWNPFEELYFWFLLVGVVRIHARPFLYR